MSSNFGQIGPLTTELAALECKKYPYRPYNGENGVSTFSQLFLIGSFWYFHVTRTSIKAWMSLNFFKWDLTLAHWIQVSDRCPLSYLLHKWTAKAQTSLRIRTILPKPSLFADTLCELRGSFKDPHLWPFLSVCACAFEGSQTARHYSPFSHEMAGL